MGITPLFTSRLFTGTLLAGALLLGAAGGALADDTPSPDASASADSAQGPTEAGTSFRTATAFRPGQQATATGSTGDYLYWMFPVDAGERATVSARVTFPDSAVRKGPSRWQIDVYDGLRRHQSCIYGAQSRAAAPDAGSVELRCTLRTVRAWAEPWSNDPLPGSYYIRVTVINAQQQDLGLPVQAAVEATTTGTGGAHAVGGKLAVPLTPATAAGQAGTTTASATASDGDGSTGQDAGATKNDTADGAGSPQAAGVAVDPENGWSSGWWSDRWIWTAAGGVLGALAGIAGYTLARPSRSYRRPPGTPPPMPPQY